MKKILTIIISISILISGMSFVVSAYDAKATEQAISSSIVNAKSTPVNDLNYMSAIDSLESYLRARYPGEFHNVAELNAFNDDSIPEQGMLTAREYAMSNYEVMLENLRSPDITEAEKNQYLGLIEEFMLWDSDDAVSVQSTVSTNDSSPLNSMIDVYKFMQEQDNYCAPATVRQTLMTINGSCTETQSQIFPKLGDRGLNIVMDYVNARISGEKYTRVTYKSEISFFRLSLRAKEYNRPIIFTMKNAENSDAWLYTSKYGHFMNLRGGIYDVTYVAGDYYIFSDPYFYPEYVPEHATRINKGTYIASYSELANVNYQLHEYYVVGGV